MVADATAANDNGGGIILAALTVLWAPTGAEPTVQTKMPHPALEQPVADRRNTASLTAYGGQLLNYR